MLANPLLALAASLSLAAAAAAQGCGVNQYPIHFVDAQGALRPVNAGTAVYDDEQVFLAFDPNIPSGTYYVHVTDRLDGIGDEVLSANDPMDRFVTVTNTNGVITLALPFTNNPNPALFGAGLGGVGQSLLLNPLDNSAIEPCLFKAWIGDSWELSMGSEWPYIVRNGSINPNTNQCAIASYAYFRIGDGSGSDVTGSVFLDADRDGVHDAGELPLANWAVNLVTGQGSIQALTDANGNYVFADVPAGSYTVELTLQAGYVVTTASSLPAEVCGCANVAAGEFGVAQQMLACDGHTIGFWGNRNGLRLVDQHGILATLPALCLRNMCGQHVAPGSLASFRCFLRGANSINMAYMLSAQLLAMHCNVMTGFVSPSCMIRDPHLGDITIAELMQRSILSLCAHGWTPPGSPHRLEQSRLKNALDNANNNRNWL